MIHLFFLLGLGWAALQWLPMKAVRLALGDLLAADAATLAPVALANKVALVKASFVLNEDLVLGTLTLADFTGSTPIAGVVGAQQSGVDPVTGDQVVTILPPAGGYRFEATNAANLPQTIYGYIITDNAGAVLLGAALFPVPITLTGAGQYVDCGIVESRIVMQPMS